jgi:hypothetical protein
MAMGAPAQPMVLTRPLPPMAGNAAPAPISYSAAPSYNTAPMAGNAPFRTFPSVGNGGGEVRGGQGNVQVEEARRVPLSMDTAPAPAAVPAYPVPIAPPVSLSPSATLGQKTIWAEIGYFPDMQTALAYWAVYRQGHPDFPVVRTRVSAPLRMSTGPVTLRVGPFAQEKVVNILCSSLAAPNADGSNPSANLRCGRVMDMGVAATTTPGTGYLPDSRYNRAN